MGFPRQEYWSGLPFPSPGESSQPRDQTHVSSVSWIGRLILYHWRHLGSPNLYNKRVKSNNKEPEQASFQKGCHSGGLALLLYTHRVKSTTATSNIFRGVLCIKLPQRHTQTHTHLPSPKSLRLSRGQALSKLLPIMGNLFSFGRPPPHHVCCIYLLLFKKSVQMESTFLAKEAAVPGFFGDKDRFWGWGWLLLTALRTQLGT